MNIKIFIILLLILTSLSCHRYRFLSIYDSYYSENEWEQCLNEVYHFLNKHRIDSINIDNWDEYRGNTFEQGVISKISVKEINEDTNVYFTHTKFINPDTIYYKINIRILSRNPEILRAH